MLRNILLSLALGTGAFVVAAQDAAAPATPAAAEKPSAAVAVASKVRLNTNMGPIVIELNAAKAPQTVENFLQYVKDKHYDGTVFHRVINGFMIQGGGFTPELVQKPTRAPIPNEASNGLGNLRGSVAMARTMDPNSATAQFFINVADNKNLDHVSKDSGYTWGYAVFGKVISGMEVVDAIKGVTTGPKGPLPGDVPTSAVVINSAEVVP
ncbi:MAG: peptidyl-prolyl cis-trans isomerase [Xanthomonadales bacterium]|nr:peptidyl-prolyl cis-trans isomerase [Xanthomonadales bacterium]MCC6560994.1 peptidyl-prolyl cis-trans isomerase [Xanthomonadales bacterium]